MAWNESHGKTRDRGLVSFAHHAGRRPAFDDVKVVVKAPTDPPLRAELLRVGNEGVTVQVSGPLGPVRAGAAVTLRWYVDPARCLMGYAFYVLPDGREAGYGVEAECDEPGCTERIDRGLGYLCGDSPDGHRDPSEPGCGNYFCFAKEHMYTHDCPNPNGEEGEDD